MICPRLHSLWLRAELGWESGFLALSSKAPPVCSSAVEPLHVAIGPQRPQHHWPVWVEERGKAGMGTPGWMPLTTSGVSPLPLPPRTTTPLPGSLPLCSLPLSLLTPPGQILRLAPLQVHPHPPTPCSSPHKCQLSHSGGGALPPFRPSKPLSPHQSSDSIPGWGLCSQSGAGQWGWTGPWYPRHSRTHAHSPSVTAHAPTHVNTHVCRRVHTCREPHRHTNPRKRG